MEKYKPTKKEFVLREVENILELYLKDMRDDFSLAITVEGDSLRFKLMSNGEEYFGGAVNGYLWRDGGEYDT